jgi:wobble nucleotide-excising tRNase
MIVRLKSICQVGVFREFKTGGSVQLLDDGNITIIFGRNTKGKSTLASIFKSLGNDDPSLIVQRNSIPPIPGSSQTIDVSYKDKGGSGVEKSAKFSTSHWEKNELKDKVLVFDQDFVHSNVISGDFITRDNKEKFTDFVVGAEGVKLSAVIESSKKDLRTLKSFLPSHRPHYIKNALSESEVTSFISLKVAEDTPTLEKLLKDEEKNLLNLIG